MAQARRIELQLAGVERQGWIGRSLPQGTWLRPPVVELEGNHLVFRETRGKDRAPSVETSPTRKLLQDFVGLADAPDEKILCYAQKWGALGLCEHDEPASHNWSVPPLGARRGCWVPTLLGGGGKEPLAAWRRFAKEARTVLDLAAQLHTRHWGKREDWRQLPSATTAALALQIAKTGDHHLLRGEGHLTSWEEVQQITGLGRDAATEQDVLASVTDDWLRLGNVRPVFRWKKGNSAIELEGDGLFGALAVQLAFAVCAGDSFAICSECGGAYIPTRKPRSDQRRFCPDCGAKAARKHGARAARARKRKQRQREDMTLFKG